MCHIGGNVTEDKEKSQVMGEVLFNKGLYFSDYNFNAETGEMAQQRGVLIALLEHQGLFPNTHMVAQNHL